MEIILHLCLKSLKVFKLFLIILFIIGAMWFFLAYLQEALDDLKKKRAHS